MKIETHIGDKYGSSTKLRNRHILEFCSVLITVRPQVKAELSQNLPTRPDPRIP